MGLRDMRSSERVSVLEPGLCLERKSEVKRGLETKEERGLVHVCAIGFKGLACK